jgi:hypothetical protein
MSADPLTALNNEYGAEWKVRRRTGGLPIIVGLT